MSEHRDYQAPTVKDLGTVQQLTANDGSPQVVDVPMGTPVGLGPIVGTDPNAPMS